MKRSKKKTAWQMTVWLVAGLVAVNVLIGICALTLGIFDWNDQAVSVAMGVVLVVYAAFLLKDWRRRSKELQAFARVEVLAAGLGFVPAPGESDLQFAVRVACALDRPDGPKPPVALSVGYQKGRVTPPDPDGGKTYG